MAEPYKDPPKVPPIWEFILYTSIGTQNGRQAESVLRQLCEHYLPNGYKLKVVDIRKNIDAVPPDVLAVPTAIRTFPLPERRVIGNLSSTQKAAEGLGLDEFFDLEPL